MSSCLHVSPPATAAPTADLRRLQSTLDRFGQYLARHPLVNCDTPDLLSASGLGERILDLIIDMSESLEAEMIKRRDAAPTNKIAAVGILLFGQEPLDGYARVKRAEQEELHPEPWHSFAVPSGDSCPELAEMARNCTSLDGDAA